MASYDEASNICGTLAAVLCAPAETAAAPAADAPAPAGAKPVKPAAVVFVLGGPGAGREPQPLRPAPYHATRIVPVHPRARLIVYLFLPIPESSPGPHTQFPLHLLAVDRRLTPF